MPPHNKSTPPYPPLPAEARICHLCSPKPHFADVSRLLTHLRSKPHLKVHSCLENACTSGSPDNPALVKLGVFQDWREKHGIDDLMAIRLKRKANQAKENADKGTTACDTPRSPHTEIPSNGATTTSGLSATGAGTFKSMKGTSRFRSYMDPLLTLPLPLTTDRGITGSRLFNVISECKFGEGSCSILEAPGTLNSNYGYPTPTPSPSPAKQSTEESETGDTGCEFANENQSTLSAQTTKARESDMLYNQSPYSPYVKLKGHVLPGMLGWRLPVARRKRTNAQIESLGKEAKKESDLARMEETVFSISDKKGLCLIVVREISEDVEVPDDEGTGLKRVDIEIPELGQERDQETDNTAPEDEYPVEQMEGDEIEMELLKEISLDNDDNDTYEFEPFFRREKLRNPGHTEAPLVECQERRALMDQFDPKTQGYSQSILQESPPTTS